MRQMHVQVRPDRAERVLQLGKEHEAFSPAAVQALRENGETWSTVFLNLPNDRVGAFVEAVSDEVEDAQFVVFPYGALPVQTPLSQVHARVRAVAPRSTLELVLSSLQSVGSWKGMLRYALYSGVVAAYGVIFNSSFLLVAAMLIAPMGAPGMVSVVGAAVGDWRMFGRGMLRFFAAIAVLVASAVALGYAYRLDYSTAIMEQITSLSMWGVAVALVAGAAGAQSQVQSERASLVTGTATGFLIAAALSPTSAVLGLALVLRRWDYAGLMAFQLVLQFAAIATGGWLSLVLYGVSYADSSVGRGSRKWRVLLASAMALTSAGLVWWQARHPPRFVKADLASDAISHVQKVVASVPGARLLDTRAHFTRPDLEGISGEGLLVSVTVEQTAPAAGKEAVESAVRSAVEEIIRARMQGVVPFVDVTVLPGREAP
jgi:uncharacterized membrane protein